MSGIYLSMSNGRSEPESRNDISSPSPDRITRLPTDQILHVDAPPLHGTVKHHGLFDSGGIHRSSCGRHILLVTGSCWLNDEDSRMATPAELCRHIQDHGFGEGPTARGNFVFAYFDTESRRLVMENGHLAVVPLYYRPLTGGIAIASEIKWLLADGKDKPNLEAFVELLHFGHFIGPETFVKGVFELPANHRLVFADGKLELLKLPHFSFSRDRPVDDEVFAELTRRFQLGISRYGRGETELSSSLSGGLDSRLAALAASKLGYRVRAMSSGEKGSLDCRVANAVARRSGIPFRKHVVEGRRFPSWFSDAVWVTEGRTPPQHMHYMDSLFNSDYLPEPQLHGLAGEAVIGGYHEVPDLGRNDGERIRKMCRDLVHGSIYWPHDRQQKTLAPVLREHIGGIDERVFAATLERIDFSGKYGDLISFGMALKLTFAVSCLSSQVLPWTDIITPYLDPTFFHFCASLEPGALWERQAQIAWGLRDYPEFGRTPRVKDGILMSVADHDPHAYGRKCVNLQRKRNIRYLVCRLSQGRINLPQRESFPAYGQWYRKWRSVRDYFSTLLLSEQSLDRGLWRREGLTSLMNDLRVGRNVWPTLGNILLAELLLRQFIDGTDRRDCVLVPSNLV
jgi:hypothetical protein